jgi:hypothetical protein
MPKAPADLIGSHWMGQMLCIDKLVTSRSLSGLWEEFSAQSCDPAGLATHLFLIVGMGSIAFIFTVILLPTPAYPCFTYAEADLNVVTARSELRSFVLPVFR